MADDLISSRKIIAFMIAMFVVALICNLAIFFFAK